MLRLRFNSAVLILLFILAFSCSEKEKIKLNDSALLNCAKEDEEMRRLWILFDTLQVTLEGRGIDVTNPDTGEFYATLRQRQINKEQQPENVDLDLRKLCQCSKVPPFEGPNLSDKVLRCVTQGLPQEQVMPVMFAMMSYYEIDKMGFRESDLPDMEKIREMNQAQLAFFIDNYEEGAAKTFILTFLMATTAEY
jgi:hypothetical protein